MKINYYLKEMRIQHYIKNLLIFIPLFCSKKMMTYNSFNLIYAFISFCFMSSAIYFINDLCDYDIDKKNFEKCDRPIVSGKIKKKYAILFIFLLIILSSIFNMLCFNIYSTSILYLYLVLNISYSFGLKKIPILDMIILITGFLLRIIYGSIISNISISKWLYLIVISSSFYIVLGKRKKELLNVGVDCSRDVIRKYSLSFLNNYMYIFMIFIFIFYGLWTIDINTLAMYNFNLIWTIMIIISIFLRYDYVLKKNVYSDPVEIITHDKYLFILIFMYLGIIFTYLYII